MNHKTYQTTMDILMPLFREQWRTGASVRFSPSGVSMLPMLRQGIDSVILSPLPDKLKKYDLPLYRRDDGHYVLHRVVRTGETYTCMGDNQFTPEHGLRHDQMIALVTAFYRGKRRIETNSAEYQLYCRILLPCWRFYRRVHSFLGRIKRRILR